MEPRDIRIANAGVTVDGEPLDLCISRDAYDRIKVETGDGGLPVVWLPVLADSVTVENGLNFDVTS